MLEEESSLVAAKVASLGSSMPMMASAVQALERRMAARVDGSCKALGRLLEDIHEVARIHAEDTKNPFKGMRITSFIWAWGCHAAQRPCS